MPLRRPPLLMRAAAAGLPVALLCVVAPAAADPPRWPAWPLALSADASTVVWAQLEGPANATGAVVYLARRHGVTVPLGFELEGFSGRQWAAVSADGRTAAAPVATASNPFVTQVVAVDLQTRVSTLVSVTPTGHAGNGAAGAPAVSATGRYVAFESIAADLVPGTSPLRGHIYLRDLRAGSTTRVDARPDGGEPDGDSAFPAISADGRYVAFASGAGDLVPGDTNQHDDVFVRDLRTGTTRRASVSGTGRQADDDSWAPSISADGRRVAFESRAGNLVPGDEPVTGNVFVRDLAAGTTRQVDVSTDGARPAAGAQSRAPAISADGRRVAFESDADNLAGGDANGWPDVFVHDLRTGATTLVSVGAGPGDAVSFGARISGDGRWVGFGSQAGTLLPGAPAPGPNGYLRDTRTGTLRLLEPDAG